MITRPSGVGLSSLGSWGTFATVSLLLLLGCMGLPSSRDGRGHAWDVRSFGLAIEPRERFLEIRLRLGERRQAEKLSKITERVEQRKHHDDCLHGAATEHV